MSIVFHCTCGKKLRAPDDAAGKRVGCSRCPAVLTVPSSPEPPPLPPRSAPPSRTVEDDDDLPRPARRRPKRRPARPNNSRTVTLVAVFGAMIFGVLALGAGAIYYFGFYQGSSGSGPEAVLIGDWESDPEPYEKAAAKTPLGVGMYFEVKMTFSEDHTFKMDMMVQNDGHWKVVSRDGNRLRVRMTSKVFGIDQDNPPTVTITIIDQNHIDFDANEPSMLLQALFRRKGSGPPVHHLSDPVPAPAPKPDPPPEPAPALPAGNWKSFTLDKLVTLELPGNPAQWRISTTPRAGEQFRFTEYTAAWSRRDILIRVYRQPKPQAKNLGGRSIAEYIGAAAVAEGGPLPTATRKFTQNGKPAAVFVTRINEPTVHLAIGDETVVCLVSIPAKTEDDPAVKHILASVKFSK
jgi:hypothetical protein